MAKPANNKVFLFFGTTGTEKEEALNRLAVWAQTQGRPEPLRIDFEKKIEELYGSGLLYQYLDQPNPSFQRIDWKTAFNHVKREVRREQQRRDVYVAMHGALIRKDYGVRSSIAFEELASLKPNALITLIDDVFVNWHHTERRAANNQEQKGRPTLAQLLIGRQHEILIADLVVSFLEDKEGRPRKPHYVLGLRHSVETLGRLLYRDNARMVYVSLPITTPRKRLQEGNPSAMNKVNSLLEETLGFQKSHDNLILFLPVTLDEILLVDLADTKKGKPDEGDLVELALSHRWPLSEVLGPPLRDETILPAAIKMPVEQVVAIAGLIEDEIRTHDFRMIDQSQKILVLSQYCEREESKGVSTEIDYAKMTGRRVEAYQAPEWLPKGIPWEPQPGKGPFPNGKIRPEYLRHWKHLKDALGALVTE